MKQKFLGVLLVVGLISSSANAMPGFDLGVVGGLNYNISSYPSVSLLGNSVTASGGLGYSVGLEADLPLINVKALYTQVSTKTDMTILGVSSSTTSTSKSLQIPVHYSIGLAGFSVGVGGFYEKSFETNGDSNYGLSAGAKASIPGTGIFAEGLVNYGLKSNNDVKSSLAVILVGLNIL